MPEYSFENIHHVPAAVFYCLDPRFRKNHTRFIEEELGFADFDEYKNPGGPQVLTDKESQSFFLGKLEKVSIKGHGIKEVVLIAHQDCGAWGYSMAFPDHATERATQVEDMRAGRRVLNEKFPDIKVSMYYMEIVGDKVHFDPME